MTPPNSITRSKGFALPMSLIAISGLTILLVGLLAVMTLERKTARSYSHATRADLAVESGLAVALASLTEIASRDDSVVFRLEDPTQPQTSSSDRPLGFRENFFTYGTIFKNNAWQAIPLFSAASPSTLGNREIETTTLLTQLNGYVGNAETIARLTEHDQNVPRAQWVEIPADSSDNSDYTIRYAYWVEDLTGRIPGNAVASEPRDEGFSTAELDPFTILTPTAQTGPLPVKMDEKRDTILTSASLRQFLTVDEAKRMEPYIHYLPSTQILPKTLIPQGFGYPDAGKPAPDLNDFIANTDVNGIANHIDRNLPTFKNRRGGFPATEDYLKTIAASIIDYSDSDGNATLGTGYRGVDSYPFVNELFDRYSWTGGTSTSVRINVETFVELWNPSNKSISGVLLFRNENKHEIKVPPGAAHKFTNSKPYISSSVNIPPNGFVVLNLGSTDYNFPVSASFPPSQLDFNQTTNSNYSLTWNGKVVDRARGGLERSNGTLTNGDSNRKWKGNSSPALDYSIGQSGDPRASYYINTWVYANNYDKNTNWGGRSLKRTIGNADYNEVRIPSWADSGSNSTPGTNANSDATRPNQLTFPANQPTMAPATISNSGRYDSLGELGNIFDPAQLLNVNSTNPVGDSRAGGGFTLAIGRPEFGAFDKNGQRSAQLLDLFSITPPSSAIIARPVNINTAPREVLRSLIANVTLDADAATLGVVVPTNTNIADIFADFVLAQRAIRPLRGPSDLNNIRKNPTTTRDPSRPADTPFFGSRDAYPAAKAPAVTWDDSGREELLRKTLHMLTFSSKAFRIVVAGEARDSSGKLLGRSTREYHYTLEPERDADGLIIPNGKIIVTKQYEKSL